MAERSFFWVEKRTGRFSGVFPRELMLSSIGKWRVRPPLIRGPRVGDTHG